MSKVFISYRRDDSGYVAGMLAQKLQGRFGTDAVFLDIDNIPLGLDFREHIAQAVGQCDILLALIGDSWIAASEDGQRRIDSPTDFVRLELEAALSRHIPVVPVLVDSARMPTEKELPISLQGLVYRNAAEIRAGRDLQHHLDVLTRGIESLIQTHSVPKKATPGDSIPLGGDAVTRETVVDPRKLLPIARPDTTAPMSDELYPTLLKALLLNVFCGCGLFYADPQAPRRWLYPLVIIPAVLISGAIISNFTPGDAVFLGLTGAFMVYTMWFLVASAYVASYIDVIRTCALKQRTALGNR